MGVLDSAKPFYRIELFEPGATDAKFIISPNVFLDTERPSDDNQVSTDIYVTSINITSKLGGNVNICELKIKHSPGNAPAVKLNSKIKIYLGYYYLDSSQGPEYSLVFTGYTSRINVQLQETELECRSELHKLNALKKKIAYSTMLTLDEVINKLAVDEGGLELASSGIAQTDIKKQAGFSISDNKSLLDHIKSMAYYSCLYVYMDVFDKFHAAAWAPGDLTARSSEEDREWVSERDKSESDSTSVYKHELSFGHDLIACHFELTPGSASTIQIICLMSSGEDTADTIEPPVVEYTPSDGADPDLPQKTYKISHITREDAEKIAENLYFSLNINLVGKAKTLGSPQLRVGDGISITGDIYEVDPFQNMDFSSANSGGSDLASKVFQVIRVNHIFNESDGFITRLDFVDARATPEAEGGEGGEEEEEEEEGEEEEEEEEEEEGEEEEEEEEEEDEREEIEFLKLPGINFNFDSAIVLTRDLSDIKGIIKVVNETDAKVLIAGHTDRMGTDNYNLNLSLLRAKSVLAISTGNRSTFREILDTGKWKIEDYQMILNDFGFYDGPEDGEERPENRQAIKEFQEYYNVNLRGPVSRGEVVEEPEETEGEEDVEEEEAPEIAEDGIIGNQTWDAIFRTMVRLIDAQIDDTKFGDTRFIGCGEFRPIEKPTEDQVRSEINRRVEFLLYPEESFPEIRGQPASREAIGAAYNDGLFRFEEISYEFIEIDLPLELEEEPTGTVQILEVEDALFHHDSGVILPDRPEGPSSEDGAEPSGEVMETTGISIVSEIYDFTENNSDKQMIITGHTDTTGQASYNFELSSFRAKSLHLLVNGEKDNWADNSYKKNKVEDYQLILKHYAYKWDWTCDPGPIDNVKGPKTTKAVRNFQETYNEEFGESIGVDGMVGRQTWGAFFDCYIKEISEMQDTTPEGLKEKRDNLNYVSETYRYLACGESAPIEAAEFDNYRSQRNRRVEILFFDPEEAPELDCPPPDGPYRTAVCNLDNCPIYKSGKYKREYIQPGEVTKPVKIISFFGRPANHDDRPEEPHNVIVPSGSEVILHWSVEGADDIKIEGMTDDGETYEVELPNGGAVDNPGKANTGEVTISSESDISYWISASNSKETKESLRSVNVLFYKPEETTEDRVEIVKTEDDLIHVIMAPSDTAPDIESFMSGSSDEQVKGFTSPDETESNVFSDDEKDKIIPEVYLNPEKPAPKSNAPDLLDLKTTDFNNLTIWYRFFRDHTEADPKEVEESYRAYIKHILMKFEGFGWFSPDIEEYKPRHEAYGDLMGWHDSEEQRKSFIVKKKSNSSCGLVVRSLWKMLGARDHVKDPKNPKKKLHVIDPPYVNGRVMNDLMKYAKICGAFHPQPRKLKDFTATRGDVVYVMKEKIVKGETVYKQHIFTIINEPDLDKREYISIDGGCDAFKGKDEKYKSGSDSCLGVQRRVRKLIQGNNELYFADDPDKRPILFWVDITKVRFFAYIVEPILNNDKIDTKLADKPKDKPEVSDDHNQPAVPKEAIFETDLNLLTQNIMFLPEELEDLGVVKYVSERRPAAVELLKEYDIIGLQEVFDDDSQDFVVRGWYNDILGDSPEWIDLEEPILDQSEELGDMSDRGVIDARPNDEEAQMVCDKHFLMGPDQADLDQDGGLVIFSKYPIIRSSAFVFSESAILFSDKMVNKGVLYARIDITPEDSDKKFYVHVFNTHTQAGDEPVIRETQFEEFKKFIENCTENDGFPIILLGDFNVEDGTDEYTRMNARFAAMKFIDVWRQLKPTDPGHTWTGEDQTTAPDSPYGDLGNVLAVDEGGPQRLDYYYHFIGETMLTSEALEIDTVPVSEEKDKLYCFDNDESCNVIAKDGSCDGLKSYTASDHIGLKLKLHVKEIEEED